MAIFDVSQSGVDVSLFRIRLRSGEDSIEVRGIRLILPMMLKRVNVDLGFLRRGGAGLQRRGHASISPSKAAFAPVGNHPTSSAVLFDRTTNGRHDEVVAAFHSSC